MRGFPARGYFIPGRDGAGARWLGIVPCRCRATGRVGMRGGGDARGVGMRGWVGMHQTIRVASDYKSSIGLSELHQTVRVASDYKSSIRP